MKLDFLKKYEFFVGVPDSQLKVLCNFLMKNYGISDKHIIAANEGNACGIATGYYLATKKIPVVYMQNSGEGNIINPVVSLMNNDIYGIPCVFVIGWRGEPNVIDEPQHKYQGKITIDLLKILDIDYFVIDKNTSEVDIVNIQKKFDDLLQKGKQVAYVIKKDVLEDDSVVEYKNRYTFKREEAIENIIKNVNDDIVISTTGKTSRELFEVREKLHMGHEKDFLTVGSMGHASSIAFGIANFKYNKRVWILDGDGAMLMHMGSIALIGSSKLNNVVHVLLNNGAHESVGGMPTVSKDIDFSCIAKGCGYKNIFSVDNIDDFNDVIDKVKLDNKLTFIEVKIAIGSRKNLGRPNIALKSLKDNFMNFLM